MFKNIWKKWKSLLKEKHDEVAAIIVEPLMQGAGGMITMPKGYLKGLRDLCTTYNVLFITDEVATGFGRTGKMFACEHENVTPDILTAGKGLTGGYLPLAITVTTDEIYDAFLGSYEEQKTFFHGHSYTGNPLGCAVAIANLELYEKTNLVKDVAYKAEYVGKQLEALYEYKRVGDIRQCGLMVGIELVKNKETKEPFEWTERVGVEVCKRSRELGMILRPLGNTIVFMPPLASQIDEIDEMLNILYQAIADVTKRKTMSGFFITATDTEVGKTVVTGALAGVLRNRGYNIGVYKPLQSGHIDSNPEGDAARLKVASGIITETNRICPYSIEEPLAPNLAMQRQEKCDTSTNYRSL